MTKKPKNAGKPALPTPPTIQELAEKLAVSVRRVSQLKVAGMPTHSVEAAIQWRQQQNNTDSSERLRIERIRLITAQRIRVENENARVRGELISRDEVAASDTRIGSAVGAAMRALETELPAICHGLPLERSRPLVKERTRAIQAMLADMQSEFWKCHQIGKATP